MLRKVKSSLSLKITALLVIMIVLCAVTLGIASVTLYRSDSVEANARRALDIAHSTAALIEPEQFAQVMKTLEKNEYWYIVKNSLDEIAERTNVAYLYVLDADYSDAMTYFGEGYNRATSSDAEIDLGETELIVIEGENTYADEMFEVLRDGVPRVTDIYKSGDFGTMVSGFVPIVDRGGAVIGVIGVDLSVNEVMHATTGFGVRILLIILVFLLVFSILCAAVIRRHIERPLKALTFAADQMAVGDVDGDVRIDAGRTDEIGILSASCAKMSNYTKLQVALLKQLADRDLTMQVTSRSPKDAMNIALQNTVTNLSQVIGDIREAAIQVAAGAQQVSNSSGVLSQGATEQACAIQALTASIAEISSQTVLNAENARSANDLARRAEADAAEGNRQMNHMLGAMADINEASGNINKIIKVIDDIAFQTNILALNAAVEAARAGQHGKGFAVVAEEVRNLAARSAAAARETANLIEGSIRKVQDGTKIANETATALAEIVGAVEKVVSLVEGIAEASNEQASGISQINEGIEQVSQVVQNNTATAEESAAASEDLSSQAELLKELVSRFTVDRRSKTASAGRTQLLPAENRTRLVV